MHTWRPVLPDFVTALWLAPLLAGLVVGTAWLCGWLKLRAGWRTGDTRKLLHFVIFTTAAGLAAALGLAAVNLLGGIMLVFVSAAIALGDGHVLYEGMARESDAPRRALQVILPLVATAAGGIASWWVFGPAATVGIAVAGWGDAVGEPVGIRWGRRRYRVLGLGGLRSWRTLEGSAAVFVASLAAAWIVFASGAAGSPPAWYEACGGPMLGGGLLALGVAAVATLVEAVSPHGLDNLTIQLAASSVAAGFGVE
jgi:phytol kinase